MKKEFLIQALIPTADAGIQKWGTVERLTGFDAALESLTCYLMNAARSNRLCSFQIVERDEDGDVIVFTCSSKPL